MQQLIGQRVLQEHAEMHAQSVDVARAAHGSAALVALAAAPETTPRRRQHGAVQAGGRLRVCVSAASRRRGRWS